MSAADAPILRSALARDRYSNADSACLLDEPFQGFQHADTRFCFRIQLELPLPPSATPLLHCFPATFAKGSPGDSDQNGQNSVQFFMPPF